MTLRAETDAALQIVGGALGTRLALDARGVAVLDFGGDAQCWLSVSEAAGCVALRIPLLQAFGPARDRVARAALRLNQHPGVVTSGRIGLIPAEGTFVFLAELYSPPRPDSLGTFLDCAMTQALALRANLRAVSQGTG